MKPQSNLENANKAGINIKDAIELKHRAALAHYTLFVQEKTPDLTKVVKSIETK